MLSRRGLIGGLAALMAAPAIVRASSIMPVKALAVEPEPLWLPQRGWLVANDAFFFASNDGVIYRCNGSSWEPLAPA